MKYTILLLIIISSLGSHLQNNNMAYYTNLSETINGEKFLSIHTYKKEYVLGQLLRGLSNYEINELLKSRNISSRTSTIKLSANAMLDEEDRSPDELYSLKALQNIDGNLILVNLEITDGHIVTKLDSVGQVYINGNLVARIKNNCEVLDLKGKTLARMTSGGVLQDGLKNEIIRINPNGSYKEKGSAKEITSSYRVWPLNSELRSTATAIHYLFVSENILDLNFEKIKVERKGLNEGLLEVLGESEERERVDSDFGKLLMSKVYQNFNEKMYNDDYKDGKLERYEFNRESLIQQQEKLQEKEGTSSQGSSESLSQAPFGSFDLMFYVDLLLSDEFSLEVFQVKNIAIKLKKIEGQLVLKKSTGYKRIDDFILKKIGLEGFYNVSFNIDYFEGIIVGKTFFYRKTSLLNPKKSISNKRDKIEMCTRDPNLRRSPKNLKSKK